MVVKVAVNGYGNIGKRVADAVAKQDGMKLVGVSKTRPNFEAFVAAMKGYSVYVAEETSVDTFRTAGLDVAGTTVDMLGEADVVVDATPEGTGAKNLENLYKKAGVKAIFEGGEKHAAIGASFNAYCNYESALGRASGRGVSAINRRFVGRAALRPFWRGARSPGPLALPLIPAATSKARLARTTCGWYPAILRGFVG